MRGDRDPGTRCARIEELLVLALNEQHSKSSLLHDPAGREPSALRPRTHDQPVAAVLGLPLVTTVPLQRV